MTKTLDEFQNEIGAWGDTTFPQSTPDTVLAHFWEEAQEFTAESLSIGRGTVHRREEEAADVLLLLLHFAHKTGFSLMDAAENKMTINRKRKWKTEPEPAGHFKHDE
jgi:NTP pyrophosphatase (non-canonical NTP hydrolase)